jgi:hypothetical protein
MSIVNKNRFYGHWNLSGRIKFRYCFSQINENLHWTDIRGVYDEEYFLQFYICAYKNIFYVAMIYKLYIKL